MSQRGCLIDPFQLALNAVEVKRFDRAKTFVFEHASEPCHPVRQLPQVALHMPQTWMSRMIPDIEVLPEYFPLRYGNRRHGCVYKDKMHGRFIPSYDRGATARSAR